MDHSLDKTSAHSFFRTGAKVIIALPILVIVAAVFMKAGAPAQPVSRKPNIVPTVLQPTAKPTSQPLDMNGPLTCSGNNDTIAVSTRVKNKNVMARVLDGEVKNYMLKEDCLYQWIDGERTGTKTCGLGEYVRVAQTMANLKILTVDSLIDLIVRMGNISKDKASKYNDINLRCKDFAIADSAFVLPRGITFKLTVSPTPAK